MRCRVCPGRCEMWGPCDDSPLRSLSRPTWRTPTAAAPPSSWQAWRSALSASWSGLNNILQLNFLLKITLSSVGMLLSRFGPLKVFCCIDIFWLRRSLRPAEGSRWAPLSSEHSLSILWSQTVSWSLASLEMNHTILRVSFYFHLIWRKTKERKSMNGFTFGTQLRN